MRCLSAAVMLPATTSAFLFAAPVPAHRASSMQLSMSTVEAPQALRDVFQSPTKVPTVSETLITFNQAYAKPILPMYRTVVNDIVQTTHLAVVDARFTYDPLFAYGLREVFTTLMRAYPAAGESEAMFDAAITSFRMSPEAVRNDAAAVSDWLSSATVADFEAAARGEGVGPISDAVAAASSNDWFLFSRSWRAGLFLAAERVGLEVTSETVAKWAALMGFVASKFNTDLENYRFAVAKQAEIEVMFKEIEIRMKKQQAARLGEKAKKAMEAAAKAEARAAAAEAAELSAAEEPVIA